MIRQGLRPLEGYRAMIDEQAGIITSLVHSVEILSSDLEADITICQDHLDPSIMGEHIRNPHAVQCVQARVKKLLGLRPDSYPDFNPADLEAERREVMEAVKVEAKKGEKWRNIVAILKEKSVKSSSRATQDFLDGLAQWGERTGGKWTKKQQYFVQKYSGIAI